MIQYFKNIFASLDNKINPIAVKEMRQAVRSRYITLLLQLYLLIELLMTGFYLISVDMKNLTSGGLELFESLVVLLFIVNLICVPVYTSNRLAKEVRDNDAMFSTTLTPMQIVRGKFYCGLIISLLLFSAAAPFIILTYLLRGLDIQQILSMLYWVFLSIQIFNCYGIVFGAFNINNVLRAILGGIMGFLLVGLLDSLPYGFSIFSSIGSLNLEKFIISTFFFFFLGESFMILAGCLLSPISFNRMTRPRIFITVTSVSLIILSYIYQLITTNDIYLEASFALALILSFAFLGIGLCERTTLSPRQIQQIPANPILRVLAYPFFTGVGSAIVWFIMMFGFLLLSDSFFAQEAILEHLLEMDYPFPFLSMFLFYTTCGMLIRIGIDRWRRNNLSQRLTDNPKIIIHPTPQKGIATVAYTFFLLAIPSLTPILFVFIDNSDLKNILFCFSPFDYLDFYTTTSDLFIPKLFGFFSVVILIAYAVISFQKYYASSSPKISKFRKGEDYNPISTEKQ